MKPLINSSSQVSRPILRLLLIAGLGAVFFMGIAMARVGHAEAGCGIAFTLFSDIENGSVGGVSVTGKARHRAILLPGDWYCIQGGVASSAGSTLDTVSWEGWFYEDTVYKDNWGSSCTSCSNGSSDGSYGVWFVAGIGVGPTIQVTGLHFFENGLDTLWLSTTKIHNYP